MLTPTDAPTQPRTYYCAQHPEPVDLDFCRACYNRNVLAGDALAVLWAKSWPSRLMCKIENIQKDPRNGKAI